MDQHTSLTALQLSAAMTVGMAVADDDGSAKTRIYHICIELKVGQFTAIRFNYIAIFAMILLAPSNLDADPMVPAG